MNADKNNKNFDELICRAIGREQPKFDFDKWKQIHKKEIDIFESQTTGGEAFHSTGPSNIWRKIMKSPIAKLAAAAVIVIFLTTGIPYLTTSTESVALGDVAKNVLAARTASFDVALESGNQPVQKSHFFCLAPGKIRQTLSDGTIIIVNYEQNQTLTLNPNDMTAKQTSLIPHQDMGASDILSQMQQRIEQAVNLSDKSVAPLGRKLIGNREAVGFRAQLSDEKNYVIGWQGRGTFTVWADPETKQPVQLEWFDEAFQIKTIATNIKLNVDINTTLFSMEIPDGYITQEVEKQHTEVSSGDVDEQRIINNLRDWTELSGGVFPSSVIGYSAIKDLDPNADISFIQKDWKGFHGFVHVNLPSMKDFIKVMQLIASGGLIGSMPPGTDWHYAGKGVKLGDAETAIFWYRPKESDTYRVIYGDLMVKDVLPKDLPK